MPRLEMSSRPRLQQISTPEESLGMDVDLADLQETAQELLAQNAGTPEEQAIKKRAIEQFVEAAGCKKTKTTNAAGTPARVQRSGL